jgi:hypothetical protein
MPRKLSYRATKTWERLGQWYGSRLADNYGPTPPDDWCELINRTDDESLDAALFAVRRESPIHVPTLGQIENAIPKRESGNSGPSKPERLASLMMRIHGKDLCPHQIRMIWTYSGPMNTFELLPKRPKPEYVTHPDPRVVTAPGCEACGKAPYRVTLDQDTTAVAA